MLLVLLAFGCANLKDLTRHEQFEDIARTYEHAIRWSDFDFAAEFVNPQASQARLPDPAILKRIRVTDYRVKKTAASQEENQVVQIVEVSYYRIDKMIVNTITERELWEWDNETKQWSLSSGLPDFQ